MDEALTKAVSALVAAATRLGFETARVWPQIVAITWIKAAESVVLDGGIIVAVLVMMPRFWRWTLARMGAAKESGGDGDGWGLALGLGTAALVGVGLMCLMSLYNNIPALFYPEAATVLRLMGK